MGDRPGLAVNGMEEEVKCPQQHQITGEDSNADYAGTDLQGSRSLVT